MANNHVGVSVSGILPSLEDSRKVVYVLNSRKKPFFPKWSLPGGKIEKFEENEEAVLREVREETGIDSSVDYSLGIWRFKTDRGNDYFNFVYVLKHKNSEKAVSFRNGRGILEVGYFGIDEVKELHDKEMLRNGLANLEPFELYLTGYRFDDLVSYIK